MKIAIVVIGEELLLGQVADVNSSEIARRFTPYGVTVESVAVVGDDGTAMRRAIADGLAHADAVITTGGLGPTRDDITKSVMMEIFGGELYLDENMLCNVEDVFRRRGLKLNELTRTQAMVPTSCTPIANAVGTAPIMWFERDDKVLVAMPGVPFETREMLGREVVPRLLRRFGIEISEIAHRHLIVTGITESDLAEHLADWEDKLPDGYHLAYLPTPGIIRLRLDGPAGKKIDSLFAELKELTAGYAIAEEDLTIAQILLKAAVRRGVTFATAESCTGGNIARSVTQIPGSSEAFKGSVVAYCNEVKANLLGVSRDDLAAYGAVSLPVVRQMAEGAARVIGTDLAVATSGIAGPGGAVEGKPVGTVCIAATFRGKTESDTFHFPGTRDRVIERSTATALLMALKLLKTND